MFVDSLEIAGGSKISRNLLNSTQRGVAFPASPADKQTFALTAKAGNKEPAIYEYSASQSEWIVTHPEFDMLPYDVSGAVFGTMNSDDYLMRHLAVRSYTLRAGFAHCLANCDTAATVDTYLTISHRTRTGSLIELGKIKYPVGQTVAVFQQTTSGDMRIMAGDLLIVKAPANVNQTLANLAFTFAGVLI